MIRDYRIITCTVFRGYNVCFYDIKQRFLFFAMIVALPNKLQIIYLFISNRYLKWFFLITSFLSSFVHDCYINKIKSITSLLLLLVLLEVFRSDFRCSNDWWIKTHILCRKTRRIWKIHHWSISNQSKIIFVVY